jgi:ABC-type lipoprotein export system ATPase subunit
MSAGAILRAEALGKREGDRDIVAGVSLALEAGHAVALTGPSGSGKTTLLQMLGLLERPSAGRVLVDGEDPWSSASPAVRATLRLERIGFVFQRSNLVPHLTVRENVLLPAWRLHGDRRRAGAAADGLLARLGLGGAFAATRAGAVSVGEAQRAAIARALVNGPAVVLADEPTGSLDSAATAAVLEALDEVPARGAALLVVTHDNAVAARFPRRLRLEDGRLEG